MTARLYLDRGHLQMANFLSHTCAIHRRRHWEGQEALVCPEPYFHTDILNALGQNEGKRPVLCAVTFPVSPAGALIALGIQPREESGCGRLLKSPQPLADSELISGLQIPRL